MKQSAVQQQQYQFEFKLKYQSSKSMLLVAFLIINLLTITSADYSAVSQCLGNCISCLSASPLTCLPFRDPSTNLQYNCLAYYNGNNCASTVNGFYNRYYEGSPFGAWSLPLKFTSTSCIQQTSNNTNTQSYPSIGPFSSNLDATKNIQFSPSEGITRIAIKIAVAVSDSRLISPSFTQVVNQTKDAFGNILIQNTTSSNNQLQQPIEFVTAQVTDILSNTSLSKNKTLIQLKSSLETSCGLVYQYEFVVSSRTVLQQVLLRLSLPAGSGTTWNLLTYSVLVGCSSYSVSSTSASQCDSCLSGFYPTYAIDRSYLESCTPCSIACSTCIGSNICITCQTYATLNPTTSNCQYSSSYAQYTDFTLLKGVFIQSNSNQINQIGQLGTVRSNNQEIIVTRNFLNSQGYYLKFYLMYTAAFSASNNVQISTNGNLAQQFNVLEVKASTLIQVSNISTDPPLRYFIKTIILDQLSLKTTNETLTLSIKALGNTNDQFLISPVNAIQYQCSSNCEFCNRSTSGTVACQKCKPFFNIKVNCNTCANGYFQTTNTNSNSTSLLVNQSYCVKCFSTCLQCQSSSSYTCTDCFTNFYLTNLQYDRICIICLAKINNGSLSSSIYQCQIKPQCLLNHPLASLLANSNCNLCLSNNSNGDYYSSNSCQQCWISNNLGWGKCDPVATSSYTLYLSSLETQSQNTAVWSSSKSLSTYSCTNDYTNLYGIASSNANTPTTMTFSVSSLPAHQGLTVFMNIFKVDYSFPNTSRINITLISGNYNQTLLLNISQQLGANICGGLNNEIISSFNGAFQDHTSTGSLSIIISSASDGIFIRQFEIYLGFCQFCINQVLTYQVLYIPRYSSNSTATGLDIWLQFSDALTIQSTGNGTKQQAQNMFLNSFIFTINTPNESNPLASVLVANELDTEQNLAKYFFPLQKSFVNGSLAINTSMADLASGGSSNKKLSSSSTNTIIDRYQYINLDERLSIDQLFDFFQFFNWFTLFTMIVLAFFGIGIIFQEFSILVQLLFLHIYISTYLLPASLKIPLSAMEKMENLNFFAYPHAASIENNFFGDLLFPSNYIYRQYNIDIYFTRSFYAVIIINIIYLGWFIFLLILNRCSITFRDSPSKIAKFFRNIAMRPINYLDQIWRYQFLTTMWASMMQFSNFQGRDGVERLNLAVCVLSFVISLIWPMFVVLYLYNQHDKMNVNHFLYNYEDVFYLKISSLADDPKYYLYHGVRFGRYLIYAVFICLFVQQSIIGPVILIFANIIEILVVYFMDIYRTAPYMAFKIFENICFIIVSILFLIIYGFSDKDTLGQDGYSNLGYGVDTLFVLMIINGIIRFIYLGYKKLQNFNSSAFDLGEKGEKEVYDLHVRPIEIAQSERE